MIHFFKQNKIKTKELYSRGFTLIEIIVVICIVAVMGSVVMYNLSAKRNDQTVNSAEDEVVALLNEARSSTLSAEQNLQYGVHFQTNQAILFQGATYVSGATGTREISIDPSINITSISLATGGSDIVFDKMTGSTGEYGSLVVKNISSSEQKTITITKAGLITGN